MRRMTVYLQVMLAGILGLVLPLAVLGYLGEEREFHNSRIYEAHIWQRRTGGAPVLPNDVPTAIAFKKLRLSDRLPRINTVIDGSSTMLTVRNEMFPEDIKLYNYATWAKSLNTTIPEVEYLIGEYRNIAYVVIGIDWFPGYLGTPLRGTPNFLRDVGPGISLEAEFEEALSLPRVRMAPAFVASLWHDFLDPRHPPKPDSVPSASGPDAGTYFCPDGSLAKDFRDDAVHSCVGFRADGSHVALGLQASTEDRARKIVEDYMAKFPGRQFPDGVFDGLIEHGGALNPDVMTRLKDIAIVLSLRGGHLYLVFPPVIPGLVQRLLDHPVAGPAVRHYLDGFAQFGRDNQVSVLFASKSEDYGCTGSDFLDTHHANERCYSKIFNV